MPQLKSNEPGVTYSWCKKMCPYILFHIAVTNNTAVLPTST